MITMIDIPEGINVEEYDGKTPAAFGSIFAFYDSTVGFAIHTADRKLDAGLWVTPQEDDAEDGSFGSRFILLGMIPVI